MRRWKTKQTDKNGLVCLCHPPSLTLGPVCSLDNPIAVHIISMSHSSNALCTNKECIHFHHSHNRGREQFDAYLLSATRTIFDVVRMKSSIGLYVN